MNDDTTTERNVSEPSTQTGFTSGASARSELSADLPVTETRLELAGVSTSVLIGGKGPPVLLLHGPGEYAAKWRRVIPDLVTTHMVIAPDLPGHGTSVVLDPPLTADRTLAWLSQLIDRACPSPPTLVGLIVGGAIAASFAAEQGDRVAGLVLVDSLGLAPFAPTPGFGQALTAYLNHPSASAHDQLWQHCAFDLERLRDQLGELWRPFAEYNLDRASSPAGQEAVQALMDQFGFPPIPSQALARISVPTTLIWGRGDQATGVAVAESASVRYGWPLHVIDDCGDDPPFEQPEAFLQALRAAVPATEVGQR
jgi:pimeloyl-ACP methyl ester carboxylesterase